MNIILIGVQGSGKGTQAKRVAKKTGYCHISTGDLFRSLSGELKTKIDEIIDKGNMVPDDLTLKMVLNRIKKDDCKKGIILDGYPRNENQAKILGEHLKIDKVIEIKISKDESIRRLSGRVACSKCGHNYNVNTQPKPKEEGVCDNDGSKLVRRKDDYPEAIEKRIKDYYEKTEPVLTEHYKGKVFRVDGEQGIDNITEEILKVLG